MGEDNSENLELLKNILRENKNFLVFVGAGASIPLRIKGWYKILGEMEEVFTGETGNLDDFLRIHGYAGTASIFYNERNDEEFYHEFLSKQFTHKEGDYFSLQVKILNLFNIILTTNYDTSFEKAIDDLNDSRESDGRPRKTCIKHYLPHSLP
jgi:NAD-dependent SIR2 family protein deacetylase